MSLWYIAAVVLGALALLAHRWSYSTIGWDQATRRNLQWLLIVALLAGAAIAVLMGVNR